jgi:ABC-2 type transport system permease protein
VTDQGAVFDLGYVPYEGERRGRRGALATTYRDGIARVFGVRRRARKKVLPWILLVISVLPAVVFVGFAFLLSTFAPEAESPFGGHAEYFAITAATVFIFVALAAPELLIPDRREGVLAIYSSRPLLPDDYVMIRSASLLTVIAIFMLAPQVLMYIGFAALDDAGFFSALVTNAGEIPKILLATGVYALGYAPFALLIATITKRRGAATGTYLGVVFIGTSLAAALLEATDLPGRRFAALLAFADHPGHVSNWIFGTSGLDDNVVATAGLDPWVSLVTILAIAAVSGAVVVWRYRRLM